MKVHELITQLQGCDQDAVVVVYCFEDWNPAKKLTKKENNNGDTELYCKGESINYIKTNYVVIGD